MRNFWMMILAGLTLAPALSVGVMRGQGAVVAHSQEKPADAAQTERQKQLADETAKLLQAATELKAAVAKSNKNELSLEVVKKADDVEKLAHDLKLKMRG